MKVAIAICIVFVVVNSVYSEDSSNKDSALSRETRDASPGRRKDSKSTRKEKKKLRKLKKKNEGKSKRNKNSKNVNKEKKRKAKKALRKKKSKNVNKGKKKKANSTQKKKKKTKTNKRNGKKRSRQGKRKTNKKDKKGKKKKKDKKKKTNIKSKDQDMRHNKVYQVRKTKQDKNSSSTETSDLPKNLPCDNNTKAVNNFKQNRRFYDKYKLLQNKLDKISVFKGYASLLGKVTKNGTECTESAKAGYILLSGCETSAAAACDNSEFNATYDTAIDCVKTINCSMTKIPAQCKITNKLRLLVEKTKECTNKKLPGTFSYCMTYVKENVSSDISGCFNECEAPTTTPSPPPTTTPSPGVIKTITIFPEGDVVVKQNESYDPDKEELTLSVPAHGDNVALTAIIGVDQMVSSYDTYCVLGDPPADITTEVNENSSNDEENEVDPDSVDKVYTFNVVEGELSDAERAELPESFQTACKGKPIQKSKKIVVDEATFNQDSLDSVGDSRFVSRQEAGCSSVKTSCARTDRGCIWFWKNPSGGTVRVTSHGISKTVQCLSCCEEKSTPSLCQCSAITNGDWKKCYYVTNGNCDFKGWRCDSTDTCLEYSEQCDGECYGSLEKCGDKCIVPGTSQNFYLCEGKCYKNTQSCNGQCPAKSNPNPCGKRCLTDSQLKYYWQCNGKCIPQSRACVGVCPPGRVDCNGYCFSQSYFDKYWWKCEGKCLYKSQQCNGSCPLGREKCGDNMCLCDVDDPKCWTNSKNFRDCDGTCVGNWKPCDQACVSGYNFCNYTYSYTYPNGKLYSVNYDRCIRASSFPKYYQYCGDCDQCRWTRDKCPPHESSTCPAKPPGEQAILLTSPSTTTTPSTTTPVMVTSAGRKRRFYQ